MNQFKKIEVAPVYRLCYTFLGGDRIEVSSNGCEMVLRNVELVVLAYMFERPLIFIECGDGDDIVCYDFSMITDDDMVNVFAPYDETDTPVKVTVR